MGYCKNCKVLFSPDVTECSYCDSGALAPNPPDPSQGDWVALPIVPGIAEAQKVGGELEVNAIQYHIYQPGTTTNVVVGNEKYDQAKEIQENVLGY